MKKAAQVERPGLQYFQNCYGRLRITGRSPVQGHIQQPMAIAMGAATGLVLKRFIKV
jgi:hypothetical protein